MPQPFATPADYEARYPSATLPETTLVVRLAAASRMVRARAKDVDARIGAGAIDPELVADVVCEMVSRTVASEGREGVASHQTSVGIFQDSVRLANSGGSNLYLSRENKRDLGIGQRAFTIPAGPYDVEPEDEGDGSGEESS